MPNASIWSFFCIRLYFIAWMNWVILDYTDYKSTQIISKIEYKWLLRKNTQIKMCFFHCKKKTREFVSKTPLIFACILLVFSFQILQKKSLWLTNTCIKSKVRVMMISLSCESATYDLFMMMHKRQKTTLISKNFTRKNSSDWLIFSKTTWLL